MLQLRDSSAHFTAKALDLKLLDKFQNICFKLILILGGRGERGRRPRRVWHVMRTEVSRKLILSVYTLETSVAPTIK